MSRMQQTSHDMNGNRAREQPEKTRQTLPAHRWADTDNRRYSRSRSTNEPHDPRDSAKRLLSDGRTRVLLACSSLPVAIETAYLVSQGHADDTGIIYAMLTVCACLLMALMPRIGGWAIVLIWLVRCVIPETTAFSILFCLLMAMTVMAYLNVRLAMAASVIAEAAAATRIWLYPWDTTVMATVCATAAFLMVALWIGSSMSWQERHEREQRERTELLRRLGNEQLANQLHHSVANDLTTILLLAQQLRVDGADGRPDTADSAPHGDDRRIRDLIEQTATESLGKVRALIATLDTPQRRNGIPHDDPLAADGNGNAPGTEMGEAYDIPSVSVNGQPVSQDVSQTVSLIVSQHEPIATPTHAASASITADELKDLAAEYDQRLHAAGLDGEIIVGGETACACTPERKAALLDILHEIVTNTMKYADPSNGYCIAVAVETGLATLSSSNAIATSTPNGGHRHDRALSGGTGLKRCRDIASDLHGEFTVTDDGANWTCLLKLPLV